MHVNVKKLVLAGVCLAISMVIILLEGVFGMSTLFLLSLSGFFIGIVIRESGFRLGAAYLVASIALAFFIAPDKIKILTFVVAEMYIFLREFIWEQLVKNSPKFEKNIKVVYFAVKCLLFNIMTVPLIFIFPQLFLAAVEIKWQLIAVVLLQPAWIAADMAYDYFQTGIWDRFRGRI